MLANVQQTTIEPLLKATLAPDSLVYTDEYRIYSVLPESGYQHKTVCHAQGEYARSGGWRRFLSGACQHNGGVLVVAALLVGTPSWDFSGEVTFILGLF